MSEAQTDTMPVPAAPDARNNGIDLLRGLAIVLVILNHIGLRIPLTKTALAEVLPRRLLLALNYNGYDAVFVFFVISGFLIAGNALARWGHLAGIDLRAFYARRFSRIVPCLMVLIAALALLDALQVQDYVIHRQGQSLGGAVAAALGLYLNWYEGHTGYLPGNWDVLWSLSIEEAFYIGFPLLCLLTRRVRVLLPVLLLLALSLPFTRAALAGNEIWQEKAYLPGMAAIATGIVGALALQRWPRMNADWRWGLLGFGTAGLAAGMLAGPWFWPWLHDGVMFLVTLPTLALLMAFQASPPRAWPGLGWFRSCGRLSYEIYLTHMFVVFAGVRLFHALGGDYGAGAWWYVPTLLACWMLGRGVARCLSMPCERWLRRRLLAAPTASPDRQVAA